MTNLLGEIFISYRRKRQFETDALLTSMRDRGLPTWRDIEDLHGEPTEEAIRKVLESESTSGAVLWVTPDVKCSNIIKHVEVRLAVERYRRKDGFWLSVVLAEGVDYSDLASIFEGALGLEDLSTWNVTKVSSPSASVDEIDLLAQGLLGRRLQAISMNSIDSSELQITVDAKGTLNKQCERALSVDWTPYFANRIPGADEWERMKKAWSDISKLSKTRLAKNQPVSLSGTPSLPAAILLGSAFSVRDGVVPTWRQRMPDGVSYEDWSPNAVSSSGLARELEWRTTTRAINSREDSLAVLVDISDQTELASGSSQIGMPKWRAVLSVNPRSGRNLRESPLSAAEASSLVQLTVDAIRSARQEMHPIRSIHLFVAGPAGFGVLLGMQLATLPPIHTYEFDTQTQRYYPAVRITT